MKEKIKCGYSKCENEFIPKNTKTKFCCASHRVMWHREKGKIPLPKDFINTKGKVAAINQQGVVIIPNVANQVKIQFHEEEIKTIPENTTLGKKRIAWLRSEISKLRT